MSRPALRWLPDAREHAEAELVVGLFIGATVEINNRRAPHERGNDRRVHRQKASGILIAGGARIQRTDRNWSVYAWSICDGELSRFIVDAIVRRRPRPGWNHDADIGHLEVRNPDRERRHLAPGRAI